MYYELRTHDPSNEKPFKGRIIYEEPGLDARKIKLQVSTDRVMHPSAEFSDVSTTILDDDKILWAGMSKSIYQLSFCLPLLINYLNSNTYICPVRERL